MHGSFTWPHELEAITRKSKRREACSTQLRKGRTGKWRQQWRIREWVVLRIGVEKPMVSCGRVNLPGEVASAIPIGCFFLNWRKLDNAFFLEGCSARSFWIFRQRFLAPWRTPKEGDDLNNLRTKNPQTVFSNFNILPYNRSPMFA